MVAYLEKIVGNAEFHEIIYFLTRSSIHYALTVSPVVSTTFVEQFWMTAKSKIINNVRYITATVAGKPVSISEASIRSDLQLNDVAGIDVLSNHAIFDTIQLMGYEGDLNTLTFNKGLFSPQFYNFSKLIFDGMMRHLDAKKKFVMYPRFILVFLTNQLKNVPVPLDHFPINALTTKVFSFMVKKGKKISRNVTPLFPSMLAQPTEDEGAVSERPSETQPTPSPTHPSEDQSEPQPDPFLRPSSSNPIPDSIPEGSGGNHGGQSSSDRSLSGNEDGLTLQSVYDLCVSLCKQVTTQAAQIKDLKSQIKQLKKKAKPVISHHNAWIKSVSMKKRLARKKSLKKKLMQKESVSKQGRKPAKSEPTVHKDPAFDDFDDIVDDAMDYMETEDAQDEGRTSSKTLSLLWLKRPNPSLSPSSSNLIPNSIPEGSGGNHRGQSSSDRSLSGNENGLTLQSVYDPYVSLCKQVTTQVAQIKDLKSQIKQLKKKAKHDAQDEGRTSSKTLELSLSGDTMVLEEKESKEKEAATSRKPASIGRIQKNLFCSSTSRFSFRKRLQADNTVRSESDSYYSF
ncbi:hypothetical protein Tco_0978490 [Tanacetum coccineum]|uniref:Uncharacterized protein n=1 Tax=Tanacetum coccineum TaxID=301880 RepID=A0ABQ5EN23_9ASTR